MQVADKSSGVDARALSRALGKGKAIIKRRFQEASIDEVSFLGPELGPLSGMLIGPEQGSWQVQEVTITSSRTGQIDR